MLFICCWDWTCNPRDDFIQKHFLAKRLYPLSHVPCWTISTEFWGLINLKFPVTYQILQSYTIFFYRSSYSNYDLPLYSVKNYLHDHFRHFLKQFYLKLRWKLNKNNDSWSKWFDNLQNYRTVVSLPDAAKNHKQEIHFAVEYRWLILCQVEMVVYGYALILFIKTDINTFIFIYISKSK